MVLSYLHVESFKSIYRRNNMKLSRKICGISPSLTLGINALAKELMSQGKDVKNFGVGEPDFDTPEYIKDAAKEAMDKGYTKYTAVPGITELRQAIAKRYEEECGIQTSFEEVVVSNGAKQSLFNAFQAVVDPGDEVIIFSPYWLTYPELVKMADGVPVYVETKAENNFEPLEKDIREKLTDRTQVILINNPSNPCGSIYSKKTLSMIADIAKERDLVIISDEIYDCLIYDDDIYSIASLSEDAKERTIIVNGMSKSYAMTGWRMGYTISSPKIARAMSSYQSHSSSNPSSISQYAALAALTGPQDEKHHMEDVFKARAELIYKLLTDIEGVKCVKPSGAFYVFPDISSALGKSYNGVPINDSVDFCEVLLKEKLVAAVPGKAFGGEGHIRLSYATSDEVIKEGVARLKEFVKELK